jgi:small subunit ribosomal protein S2
VPGIGVKELLEAGVHFGHQTRRWNPKMRRFIHGERDGIYIIDLLQTEELLERACQFAGDLARRGGTILFVGTKKQARDVIAEQADRCGMPYVNQRWLGGLLTNFQTISLRIRRLHDLERYQSEGQLQLLPTRERISALADLEKLQANLGGVKNMERVPSAMFVIDLKTEAIAVREAQRLRIPIIGLVDTNCDPDGIDYVVPGNDDAIRSCAAVTKAIGDVVADSYGAYLAEEERARLERERREAEEQARREAEEQARREAEEAAKAAAAAQAEAEAAAQAETEAPAAPTTPPARPRRQSRREAQPAAEAQATPAAESPATEAPAGGEAEAPPAEAPATEAPVAEAPAEAEAPTAPTEEAGGAAEEPPAPEPEAPAAETAPETSAEPPAEQPTDQSTEEAS